MERGICFSILFSFLVLFFFKNLSEAARSAKKAKKNAVVETLAGALKGVQETMKNQGQLLTWLVEQQKAQNQQRSTEPVTREEPIPFPIPVSSMQQYDQLEEILKRPEASAFFVSLLFVYGCLSSCSCNNVKSVPLY